VETLQDKINRMIDANFNRAREGLRVVEDIARFVLDDKKITEKIKHLRSEIGEIEKRFSTIDYRNTEKDVGVELTSEIETKRGNILDIFTANIKRIQESLRVLEEAFKTIDNKISERFKTMRYEAYTLEKEIHIILKGKT